MTKKYEVLLILDEVGTGFSRTGKLYGMNHENVVPDIVTFAKGIGNGATVAATATSQEIAEKLFQNQILSLLLVGVHSMLQEP